MAGVECGFVCMALHAAEITMQNACFTVLRSLYMYFCNMCRNLVGTI